MLGFTPVRVCDACVGRVRGGSSASDEAKCPRCGEVLGMESARFAAALGMAECTACRLVPPPFERAVSFASYDNEMRDILHKLKFGALPRIAEHILGDWMAEAILQLEAIAARDLLVVPVPLHTGRTRQRGYNQAALLAKAGVRRLRRLAPGWHLVLRPDVLMRTRDTKPLHALQPEQRRRGLKGAFRVEDATAVSGREVLLIDDILTTGATARECARVLLRAGATRVWVATVARAQPESVRGIENSIVRWDVAADARQ